MILKKLKYFKITKIILKLSKLKIDEIRINLKLKYANKKFKNKLIKIKNWNIKLIK